jgi:hypothetical protein
MIPKVALIPRMYAFSFLKSFARMTEEEASERT